MRSKVSINTSIQTPVYKQLIFSIRNLIDTGEFKEGDFIPSMNELSNELNISKETVKKAYSILREKGVIDSSHGKGFYVTNSENNKIKILLLFDNISNYKQILYSSFLESLEDSAEITIRLHNQDIELFKEFIEENLDNFDYYIITPHFSLNPSIQKKAIKILKKIPNRKLILLDRYFDSLPGNFGAVYQDFENDVYDGLSQRVNELKKFKKLNVVSGPGSLYAPLINKGINKFCIENNVPYIVHKNIHTDNINKDEAYLILNNQLDLELIELARIAKLKGCKIGKDIGVISYNESPINEIVLDGLTVLSTDFKKMGQLAAKMITEKKFKKIKCDFRLIRRSTF